MIFDVRDDAPSEFIVMTHYFALRKIQIISIEMIVLFFASLYFACSIENRYLSILSR